MTVADQSHPNAGERVYLPLVEEQLQEEQLRKGSLEQRGLAVITTSGVLVSLLFAIAAVVTESNDFVLPSASRAFIVIALMFFIIAAVGGIAANAPLDYRQVSIKDLRRFVGEETWSGPADIASRRVVEAKVSILARARELNVLKGKALFAAIISEVIAVIILAIAVGIIMIAE